MSRTALAAVLFAAATLAAPAHAELPPHLRATLAPGEFGRVLRLQLFAHVGGALLGSATLEPQDRSTAVALGLGATLCPAGTRLGAEPPDRRAQALLRCGPWLPDGVDAAHLLAEAGCADLLRPLSPMGRELALGPGAFLALAWQKGAPDDGPRLGPCRAALVPTLLAPLVVEAGDLRPERLVPRLEVTVDRGRVTMGLVSGGVRLVRDAGGLRAQAAPAGRIEIPARAGTVDRAAVSEAAVALRALLGDAPGAASLSATVETPYADVVTLLDALRQAPSLGGGASAPLFPDVTLSVAPEGEAPRGGPR